MTGASNPHERFLARRAEDAAALTRFGFRFDHLDFLDVMYRTAFDPKTLVDGLSGYFQGAGTVFVPAGIGGHPDHEIVRDACLEASWRSGRALWVYADRPYASSFGWPPSMGGEPSPYLDVDAYWGQSLSRVAEYGVLGEPFALTLTDAEIAEKESAMRAYATQFPVIEAGPSRELTHPQRISREVYWPMQPQPFRGEVLPLAGLARLQSRVRGMFADRWVGDELEFAFQATAPIGSVSVRGRVADPMPRGSVVRVELDGVVLVEQALEPGPLSISCPLALPEGGVATLRLVSSATVNHAALGLIDDGRELAILIESIEFSGA